MAEDHASWILYRRRNYDKIEIFHCLAYSAKQRTVAKKSIWFLLTKSVDLKKNFSSQCTCHFDRWIPFRVHLFFAANGGIRHTLQPRNGTISCAWLYNNTKQNTAPPNLQKVIFKDLVSSSRSKTCDRGKPMVGCGEMPHGGEEKPKNANEGCTIAHWDLVFIWWRARQSTVRFPHGKIYLKTKLF